MKPAAKDIPRIRRTTNATCKKVINFRDEVSGLFG